MCSSFEILAPSHPPTITNCSQWSNVSSARGLTVTWMVRNNDNIVLFAYLLKKMTTLYGTKTKLWSQLVVHRSGR